MKERDYLQSKLKFSVVISAFNEEENLEVLYARLVKVMRSLGEPHEMVFVDDGSTDSSFQILTNLHRKDGNVKVIRFTRNFGHDVARAAGLSYCRGENAILMDADLQDQPEDIPKLLAKLREGYDIVYGRRRTRRDGFFKNATSKAYFRLLSKLTDGAVDPEVGSLQIIARRVIDCMNELGERCRFYGGLLGWLGFPYALVDVEHGERLAGKTKYSLWKLMRYAADGVISFSDVPLHVAGYFGLLVSAVSFVLGVYVLIRWFVWGIPVAGYASIVVSIFFLGGLVLVVLWAVGQYIGRIHTEVKQRPLYVIRDMIE